MSEFNQLLEAHQPLLAELKVPQTALAPLATYLDLLWAANLKLNLFSRKQTREDLVDLHLLDSLLGLPFFPEQGTLADLGSGGGFPAIPIALCRPDLKWHLYEKSPLKQKFLRSLLPLCPQLEIVGLLPEKGPKPATTLITARGFKSIDTILSMTKAYYRAGKPYLLYKGRAAKIKEEIEQAGLSQGYELKRLPQVGKVEERYLVLIQHVPKPA